MPPLTPERRADIERRQIVLTRIKDSFKGRQYVAQHCRFCNFASNGQNLDEAIKANDEHERTHPEQAEYECNQISMTDLIAALHDHECDMRPCECKCGCQAVYCHSVGGNLCASCVVAANRGHDKSGKPAKDRAIPAEERH